MRIATKTININPIFPVNRMLGQPKHLEVDDDLHGRIFILDYDSTKPFVHISFDATEIWKAREDSIKKVVVENLGYDIDLIVSATHSHNTPCWTTDDDYFNYILDKTAEAFSDIEFKEYKEIRYIYDYEYFDKVGASRVEGHVAHVYAETLSFYGDNKRVATFLIHNVHPTIRSLFKGNFTAEYPGLCISELTNRYPDEFFSFLLGPAGDTSPHFVRLAKDQKEMERLSLLLTNEFDRQLKLQSLINTKLIDVKYEETTLDDEREILSSKNVWIPEGELFDEELKALKKLDNPDKRQIGPVARELRDFEQVKTHHFAHLVLSQDYSIIFEPFETYSEFYGAVDKKHTTIATISHGFEHYMQGLYLSRLSIHGCDLGFTLKMKKRMWEILAKYSRGVEV